MNELPNNPKFFKSFISTRSGKIIISLFIVVSLGILGINFYNKLSKLTNNEQNINDSSNAMDVDYYEGKVSYVGDQGNNVSYALINDAGEEMLLLRSSDDKLAIVEGLKVKVYGNLIRGSNGQKDTMIVKEILLNNGTN